jgi:nucleoside-diphosphate-sugar epimerase
MHSSESLADTLTRAYAGKRLLVTGGCGFLGTNVIGRLREVRCAITRLSMPGTDFPPVEGAAAMIDDLAGDVRERATWERALDGADVVFHFAAQTSVYVAQEDAAADLAANVTPMALLIDTCRRMGARPGVLFSGTVTQAGITARLPVDESHPDRPVTIYDLHKLMAEQYLAYASQQGIVRGVTLRLANVYGPGPASSSADRGVLNLMVRKALRGEPLSVYGAGDRIRDYVYVEDVARAFLLAGAHLDALGGQHFVIGSGEGHSLAEAFNLAAERAALKTGQRVPLTHVEPPAGLSPIEDRDFVADTSRFRAATGWEARVSLAEGIDRMIEAFQRVS